MDVPLGSQPKKELTSPRSLFYYIMTDKPINQTDELIEEFIAECEKEAAKLEITVDYYLAEFV